MAVGLGVDGAPQGAFGRGHLPLQELRRLARDPRHLGVAGAAGLPGVDLQQQAVVVEHLLEVGHLPLAVGRVAVEAAAQLVVDAAPGHVVEGGVEHLAGLRLGRRQLQQQKEIRRGGELRRPAEAAPLAVEAGAEPVEGGADHRPPRRPVARGAALLQRPPHVRGHLVDLLEHVLPAVGPGLGDPTQHRGEAGAAVAVVGGEVGAGVERLEVRRQEHRVGPPPLAGEHLGRRHVDLVEVGAFLAVDLDADEAAVHQLGDRRVGERFALHDVAPVAGRVAHRQEDRLVLAARPLDRLRRPTGTSRPGCPCAAGDRGCSPGPAGSRARSGGSWSAPRG